MLQIQNLTKTFGTVRAVSQVSLDIPEGQMVGIIGRSGAGKSTLLRLVNRLIEPSQGSIHFNGKVVTRLKGRELLAWRADCAMIFQQFNLVNRLDVLTNVLIGRINRHGPLSSLAKRFSPAERALAIAALDRLDLADQALQRADTLSGGQQQRVAIARAILQDPKVILADEPIASLDPRNAAKVMDALAAINREEGLTVLCNLHTLDTARHYCDRIIGMAAGEVVFDGTPERLTKAAVQHLYGAADSQEECGEEIAEAITSTSLPAFEEGRRRAAAQMALTA
ncbi:phosphonate ABC transporter ATP-binding protein [Pelagibius sp. 7325]|uniref:phosphonate ABC transporter ATP-binding protein n=1 Tax=Pelagibius sp. 7325 TaxID=3131994 RepID=UPI0030ECFCF4